MCLVNMGKKADLSVKTVVTLIILLLVASTLTIFAVIISKELKEDSDIEVCRLSILAQAQTRKLPGTGISTPKTLTPLDCPRRYIKIFDNKVEINEKKSKKYEFKKLTFNELNNILAEEMRLCWYKLGQGNTDLFEDSLIFSVTDKTCLVCTEIEFDSKLRGQSFGGLLDFIKSKNIPKGDVSYFKYLTESQKNVYPLYGLSWDMYNPLGYGISEREPYESTINTDDTYSIYFLAHKPSWVLSFLTHAYYLGIGKGSKLYKECENLVN